MEGLKLSGALRFRASVFATLPASTFTALTLCITVMCTKYPQSLRGLLLEQNRAGECPLGWAQSGRG